MSFIFFLFLGLAAISGTVLTILVGSHLSIIPVKFESNWPKGLGGVCIEIKLFTFFNF